MHLYFLLKILLIKYKKDKFHNLQLVLKSRKNLKLILFLIKNKLAADC
jgi:hypothetical protein